MIAQRVGVSALRRGALRPTFFTQHVSKLAVASTLSSSSRSITTEKLSPADETTLLATQRLKRPLSPHLSIYKLDQTWFGASALNRITGCLLSGSLYAYCSLYTVAPLLGWHLESASVAAAFGTLPFLVKGAIKFVYAWPFVFHCVNGVRHLTWDMTWGFARTQIHNWGWAITGVSFVGALGLAFLV